MITAAELMVRVGADTGEAERKIRGFGANLNQTAGNLARTGTMLTLGVTTPLVGVATQAVRSAATFDQSMVMAQVATGATEAQMDQMVAQAIELGAVTNFSAGQAAEAMLELGKAGMDAEAVMAAMPGVVDLAAAGKLNLNHAAAITAATLNAFELEAEQSGYIANMLAAAANASAADVTDLAAGVQQAGFAFNMAGFTAADLAASLALLTNVGLTGSDAGTALKNAIIRMISPTKEAKGVMDELGISFFDVRGEMLPFPDILANIIQGTADLAPEQRYAALETIFLSDGLKAMIPLLNAGTDGFAGMIGQVTAQGAAARMAEARMSGMAGAIEYIKGSVDSFLIGAARPFGDVLSRIIVGAADAVTAIGTLPAPALNSALAFLAVVAAAGPVIAALGAIAGAVAFVVTGPFALAIGASAVLAAAWAGDWGGIQGLVNGAIGRIRADLGGFVSAVRESGPASAEAAEAVGTLPPALQPIGAAFVGASAGVRTLWSAIMGGNASQSQLRIWGNIVDGAFGEGTAAKVTAFGETFRSTVTGMAANFATRLQGLPAQASTTWSLIETGAAGAAETLRGAVGNLSAQLGPVFAPALERVRSGAASLIPAFAELSPAIGDAKTALTELVGSFAPLRSVGRSALQAVGSWATIYLGGLGEAAGKAGVAVTLFATSALGATLEAAPKVAGKGLKGIENLFSTTAGVVSGSIRTVTALLEGNFPGALNAAKDTARTALGGIGTNFELLKDIVAITYTGLKTTLITTFDGFGVDIRDDIERAETVAKDFWAWLTSLNPVNAVPGIAKAFQDRLDAISLLIEEFSWSDWIQGGLSWSTYISPLTWPAAIGNFAWSSFVPRIDWSRYIPSINWPSISFNDIMGAVRDAALRLITGGGGDEDRNATGSALYGGGLTWVGERGPELVALPRGSAIYNHRDSVAMAGGAAITIGEVHIHNEADYETFVARLRRDMRR